jgi:hypothetical protein
MIFTANLGSGQDSEQLFIETSSWSNCVSYCENTGENIRSINQLSTSSVTPIINVSGITSCFVVTDISSGNSTTQYYVWDSSFESVTNWIANQGDMVIRNIMYQKISYVLLQ